MYPLIARIAQLTPTLGLASGCAAPILVPASATFAAQQKCKATDDQLLAAIRSVHEKQRNLGVQAAVHLNGRTVFSRALGVTDRD